MNDITFFKPTPIYKEFVILDLIDKKEKITQRYMSDYLSISVSMVNIYLTEYEKNFYIERKYINSKTVIYKITKKGIERKELLNIQYLKASSIIYNLAKDNVTVFLKQIIEKGYKNILLYGAGEVAEILLQTIKGNRFLKLKVLSIIDEDKSKHGKYIHETVILGTSRIYQKDYDGILISSYTHKDKIYQKLVNYNERINILEFFKN